jgi:hypothetical protein
MSSKLANRHHTTKKRDWRGAGSVGRACAPNGGTADSRPRDPEGVVPRLSIFRRSGCPLPRIARGPGDWAGLTLCFASLLRLVPAHPDTPLHTLNAAEPIQKPSCPKCIVPTRAPRFGGYNALVRILFAT